LAILARHAAVPFRFVQVFLAVVRAREHAGLRAQRVQAQIAQRAPFVRAKRAHAHLRHAARFTA
jgi:hypothetical protein